MMPFTHGRSLKVQLQCTVMAIMIFQNNETEAIYVSWCIYQAMLCDVHFFSYVHASFCSNQELMGSWFQ